MPETDCAEGSVLEDEIRDHARAERWDDAATVAILGYGPQLLSFMRAASSSDADADDAFGELSERLWRKLPEFGWRSSFRTWAYVIARRLLVDRRRAASARDRREVPWSDVPAPRIAAAIRSTLDSTPRRNDARLALVRSLLDEDERALLVLRVERRMRWPEIVRILVDVGDDPERIDREAARLRKQFARIKERLRRGIDRS